MIQYNSRREAEGDVSRKSASLREIKCVEIFGCLSSASTALCTEVSQHRLVVLIMSIYICHGAISIRSCLVYFVFMRCITFDGSYTCIIARSDGAATHTWAQQKQEAGSRPNARHAAEAEVPDMEDEETHALKEELGSSVPQVTPGGGVEGRNVRG